ncbi:HdeD family acid-resistance protein [Rhodopila globiformis]|nr:HdeD family acid-resistance protein [Rhodopila globiformis]
MANGTPQQYGPLGVLGDLDPMNGMLARHWWTVALRGVIAVLFGLVALAAPGAALLSLALLFGAYLLADGVIELVVTWRAAKAGVRWGPLLWEAVLSIIMGLIALAMPAVAVWAFVILLAAWALITGVLELVAAFRLHASHGRWWLALGGIVSLVWGLLLAAAPMIGAVVVAWWLGFYAIFFGITLLVAAWRLRERHIGLPRSPGAPA